MNVQLSIVLKNSPAKIGDLKLNSRYLHRLSIFEDIENLFLQADLEISDSKCAFRTLII